VATARLKINYKTQNWNLDQSTNQKP